MPVCKHKGGKHAAVLMQNGSIHGVGHHKMRTRQHEDAVKHGHCAPHVGVESIHVVEIVVQHEPVLRGVGEMHENFGVVLFNRLAQHEAGRLGFQIEHAFKNVGQVFVATWEQFAVFLVQLVHEGAQLLRRGRVHELRFLQVVAVKIVDFHRDDHGGKWSVERHGVVHEVVSRNDLVRGGDARKPPVNDAHVGFGPVHHEVFGFQVVVHDAQCVHGHHRVHQHVRNVVIEQPQTARVHRLGFHPHL